jgi:penicillin-binding protein 1A
LYSLAIEEAGFNPTTTVVDVQQNFGSYGLVPATGATCTGRSTTMASALMWSRNCATAYIMKQLGNNGNEGSKRFVEFLKNCNIKTKVDAYPSIAIGSCEISLFEMMQGYSMFPGRGFNSVPIMVARIEDRNGNVLENFLPAQRKEVISEVTAYYMALMMQGVVQQGTGRRLASYGVTGDVAGKTGTTNDNSDAWFIGYTPQLLAGAWVGADDRFVRFNSSMGEGSSAALPIWGYFYAKAVKDKTLGLDVNSKFLKPEVMNNDIIYDYLNTVNRVDYGAEGEDQGNGNSNDYTIPGIEPEEMGAESDLPVDKTKPGTTTTQPANTPPAKTETKPPAPTTKPNEETKKVEEEKLSPRELRQKRRQEERDKKKQQDPPPKAILPKRDN